MEFPILNLEKIATTSLSTPNYQFLDINEYPSYPGKEHYKLLAYLSHQTNNSIIVDIGTHRGFSALALSQNATNIVHTFDIVTEVDSNMVDELNNVKFHIENLWDLETRKKWQSTILSSAIIFIDIEPHEGHMEYEFYCYLHDHNYQGLLIADDIWYFKGMRDNFWYNIPSWQKHDATNCGHWSGTGIIKPCLGEHDLQKHCGNKSWTFVTGYFDLTETVDATDSIKARNHQFYLESSNTTMSIDANLVVYCEEKYLNALREKRPKHLRHKTKYICCQFEDFPLNKYRVRISENRKTKPTADPRNTVSYYLFCMARYAMLKQTMKENLFHSTHFAWINVCIERYGYKNVATLEDVIQEYRDCFSTCYIDYIPRNIIHNLPLYFQHGIGRCSLCSGFFTGDMYHMSWFCDEIENQFLEYLEQGYGHADEQLYSAIYFRNPNMFQVYYGDYRSMITNYIKIVEDVDVVINFLMRHSSIAKDWNVWNGAYNAVLQHYEEKTKLLGLM